MGRRYTGTSSEYVHFATAGLAGLAYTYGTWALWCNIVAYPTGYGAFLCTNSAVGATFEMTDVPGSLLDIFDGTTDRTATGPTAGVTALIGTTKATGTQTARSHVWVPTTGVMTHAAYSGTNVDSGTLTALTLGNESATATSPNGPINAEMFEVALWNKVVMTDSEWERLARWKDWSRFAPDFWHRDSDGREVGDISRTLGRFQAKQTARSGTSRGAAAAPPGFGSSAFRRRR